MKNIFFAALALLSLGITGCGGLFDNVEGGSMSAKVDGENFKANIAVVATIVDSIFTVTGSATVAEQLQLIIQDFDGEGTYEITSGIDERNQARWTATIDPTETYTTIGSLGTGKVVITSYDGDNVKGTFEFTAKNTDEVEVEITEGEFDAEIQ